MAQTGKTTTSTKTPLSIFPAGDTEGFSALSTFGTSVMENMGRYGTEVVEFMSLRLQEDFKTQHELMQCRDMSKLAEIQSRYLKTAMDQYSAETGKLMKMGTEIFGDAFKNAKG
ncbi:MAG: phasin family protein [Pseudomonadota bacterium]|jgi:hypothetical protein|nr:phasin family protein [Pseudomonadota bacterium]